jgi:hypothetical protein
MQEVRVSRARRRRLHLAERVPGDTPNWSTEDVSTARWLLAKQRQALDDAHPRDKKTRETLRRVVDVETLERALAAHD